MWAIYGLVTAAKFGNKDGIELNAVGDFLAGWFAPLALFWFLFTVYMQGRELFLQRKEFEKFAEEQKLSRASIERQANINDEQMLMEYFELMNASIQLLLVTTISKMRVFYQKYKTGGNVFEIKYNDLISLRFGRDKSSGTTSVLPSIREEFSKLDNITDVFIREYCNIENDEDEDRKKLLKEEITQELFDIVEAFRMFCIRGHENSSFPIFMNAMQSSGVMTCVNLAKHRIEVVTGEKVIFM